MNTRYAILFSVALMIGCTKTPTQSWPVESDSFGKNLCPIPGVSIQKSADGLQRTIKTERDWLGDKYGPMRFTCEASSIERLLEFVALGTSGPSIHFDGVVGRDFLPKGTYRYSFQSKTWDDNAVLLKDVIDATSVTFSLTLEVSHSEGKTTLVIKPNHKLPSNTALEPTATAPSVSTNK